MRERVRPFRNSSFVRPDYKRRLHDRRDEGKETGRKGVHVRMRAPVCVRRVITFRILIPWIYGHDFRFEIIDRRKPQ